MNGQIIFSGTPNELEKPDQPKKINETINIIEPDLTEEDILSPLPKTNFRIVNKDRSGTLPQQVIIRVSITMALI